MKVEVFRQTIAKFIIFFFVELCLQRTFYEFEFIRKNIEHFHDHYARFNNYNIDFVHIQRFLIEIEFFLNILQLVERNFDNVKKKRCSKNKSKQCIKLKN